MCSIGRWVDDAAPKSPPTSPVQKRPPSAKPPARPPPPNKTPTERRVYFPDDQSADADSLTVDEITVASVAETLNTEDASDEEELDEDACVATAQTLDALAYAVARSRACHPPFLRASNRRLFSVAFRCPDPGVRRSAAACACAFLRCPFFGGVVPFASPARGEDVERDTEKRRVDGVEADV